MAKRISQSSIKWAELMERVPPNQKVNLQNFKAKSDGYLRRVMSNPEQAPKIDWAQYKKTVPVAGMVDRFQKEYEALKVPYPADTMSAQVDAQWNEVKQKVDQYVKESNANIAKFEKEIATIKALIPFDQMTMEDFKDAYPDLALDPINKPTFWPHNPEEQLDYVNPNKEAGGHH